MNRVHYPAERLVELFRRQTVATFPELAAALETSANRTVFRKLSELDYRTSYSHRGAYYTLDSLARYDALWAEWKRLRADHPDTCPTIYTDRAFSFARGEPGHRPGMGAAIDTFRQP